MRIKIAPVNIKDDTGRVSGHDISAALRGEGECVVPVRTAARLTCIPLEGRITMAQVHAEFSQ